MPRARPEPPVKRRLRPGHGDGHTRARTHETCEATPPWCVVGDCGYPGCAPGGPIEHCSPTSHRLDVARGACCEGGWGELASVWHHSTRRPICSLVHPPADGSFARCQPSSSRRRACVEPADAERHTSRPLWGTPGAAVVHAPWRQSSRRRLHLPTLARVGRRTKLSARVGSVARESSGGVE